VTLHPLFQNYWLQWLEPALKSWFNSLSLHTWVLEAMANENVSSESDSDADVPDNSEVVDHLVHLDKEMNSAKASRKHNCWR
jgi:hypothetical protein